MYCGEMLKHYLNEPTLGQLLPSYVTKTYRPLIKYDANAVYSVTIRNDNIITDWYFYLRKVKNKWKLEAVRTFALPEFFWSAIHELGIKAVRTPEEENQYDNMRLTANCDSILKDYLKENINSFEQIASFHSADNAKEALTLAKNLHLSSVIYFRLNRSIVNIIIGGIMDNEVGYLYVPDGIKPPEISPNDFIYVEYIIGNWYIYRTT